MMKRNNTTTLLYALLAMVMMASCQTSEHENVKDPQIKVAMRAVGNELLLLNNDSTSYVAPIKKVASSTYQITFKDSIAFDPDDLNGNITEVFEKAGLPKAYLVEVIQCNDGEVAYSYDIKGNVEKNIIPCGGRLVPFNCYTIEVTFTGLKEVPYGNEYLFYLLVLLVLSFLFFIFYTRYVAFQKRKETKTNTNATTLGMFNFYPEQLKLVRAAHEIPLTQKECELLEILVAKPNQVVTREELTKRVWEDNGVIVGRSLDTYISKLRKKLQEDDSLKIVNVHGVGYKLETT